MMRRFFLMLKDIKNNLLLLFYVLLVKQLFELIIPVLMANIIDYGVMQK